LRFPRHARKERKFHERSAESVLDSARTHRPFGQRQFHLAVLTRSQPPGDGLRRPTGSPSRTNVSTPSFGVLEQVIGWPPHPRLAKHHNGRAAEAKDRLFLAALERGIERVHLNDSSNRQGSDLHECEAAEVAGCENIYVALVAEENVRFVQECMPVDGPEAMPAPIVIQSPAMIGVVDVVVIDRGETHQKDGPADERPRALRIAENLLGT
jgi:hypothetical protein